MVGVRDLIRVLAAVAGAMAGAIPGWEKAGWPGALLLGFAGLVGVPWLLDLPWKMLRRRTLLRLHAMSVENLKAALAQKFGPFAYHDVFRALRLKGEAMEGEVPRLVRWLEYPAVSDRYMAHAALREFFPEVASHLGSYSATQNLALRRQGVQGLRTWLNLPENG